MAHKILLTLQNRKSMIDHWEVYDWLFQPYLVKKLKEQNLYCTLYLP